VELQVCVRFEANLEPIRVDGSLLEPWDLSDPDYRLYTQRFEGLIQVTEPVVRLADALAGRAGNAWDAVSAFWWFFFDRMSSGRVHHDELDPRDPLGSLVTRGWFDCYTGSALLAGLCRARGIPARVVNGFTLYALIPSNHYWMEVLLPPYGWVSLDLLSHDLSAGDREQTPWSRCFLGGLDYRMRCQCFPRQIVGPPGVRFPESWYVLPTVREQGLESAYYSLETGDLLYRDWVRVGREAVPEGEPARDEAPFRPR
jgi:transglutaminase-like putative cysteine protease